ncbi:uncharacterized protein PAC_08780 [Phialocephala subalpina]|uniref:Major facilitator superfamily (MFS) profile domain-containing protein n=1 Tax=Phialocephala subalpina TaxID=576137 RepID=A0A1L7X1I7_9HELO|nr:uncharacterized protein PAC_08780 [Phialocephala subalpina]
MASNVTGEPKIENTSHVEQVETQDDVPKRSAFKDVWANKRVMAWCFLIFLLPINFGYEVGTVGNLLAVKPFLEKFGVQLANGQWEVKTHDQQLLNAGTTVGLFISAFSTGFLSDIFGRRSVVLTACLLCASGILLQYFSQTIPMLFGGKLLSTFGFGLGHSLGPVFVAELAPTSLRGICLTLINTMIVIGQWTCALVVYGCSHLTTNSAWRIPIITQLIPPGILLLIGVPFLPESPSWLLMKGRREDAAKSFRKFNGPKFDVESAIVTIEEAIKAERQLNEEASSWIDCFKGPNLRRTIIICMVYIAQQFIGVNFIAGYLAYFFLLAGVNNPLGIAQAAYAIQLFGNMCSWPLVDRFGRRPLIVYGTMIMTASLLLIGGLGTLSSPQTLKATVALIFLPPRGRKQPTRYRTSRLRHPIIRQHVFLATRRPFWKTTSYRLWHHDHDSQSSPHRWSRNPLISPNFKSNRRACDHPEMKGRTYYELEEMFQARVPARKFKGHKCQAPVRNEKVNVEEDA